jgi:hypothetical protein
MGSVTHLLSVTGNEGELHWDFSAGQFEKSASEVSVKANIIISAFPRLLPKLEEMKDRKIILGYEL